MICNVPSNSEISRLSWDVNTWVGLLHLYNKVTFHLCIVFLTWMAISTKSLRDGEFLNCAYLE